VADLASISTYADYAEIAEKIRDLDIAFLILNAGWTCFGHFKQLTPQEVE
jgi:short-subunit dehydrogenase